MCSPCGPMVCYKYEDCGPPKSKAQGGGSGNEAKEGGGQKKSKDNQLKRVKSRELRGGVMYYSCHCIKRNGLQHDCRRTGCGGEPPCLTLPDPVCAPSQLARARGLADPAPLAQHMQAVRGGGAGPSAASGFGGGKKFVVCELKGIMPSSGGADAPKCCKCPTKPCSYSGKPAAPPVQQAPQYRQNSKCPCAQPAASGSKPCTMLVFDEQLTGSIMQYLEGKPLEQQKNYEGGKRGNKGLATVKKEEPCTRPGCIHWQPPPPCIWDLPCKADCFETPPGIQPGRNPLVTGEAPFITGFERCGYNIGSSSGYSSYGGGGKSGGGGRNDRGAGNSGGGGKLSEKGGGGFKVLQYECCHDC